MTTIGKNYMHCDMVLERILYKCAPYIGNNQYVYKKCICDTIVVLKKTDKTITNESRKSIIDPRYAKFRGNRFEVVCIFDAFDCDEEYVSAPSCYKTDFYYKIDCIVEVKNFDPNIEDVCSTGIHYFKDVRGAYFYNLRTVGFSGQFIQYYDDGQKMWDFNLVNGKLEGNYIEWYNNGKMKTKKNYTDFVLKGECTEWNDSGQIISKRNYVNGIPYVMAP